MNFLLKLRKVTLCKKESSEIAFRIRACPVSLTYVTTPTKLVFIISFLNSLYSLDLKPYSLKKLIAIQVFQLLFSSD